MNKLLYLYKPLITIPLALDMVRYVRSLSTGLFAGTQGAANTSFGKSFHVGN